MPRCGILWGEVMDASRTSALRQECRSSLLPNENSPFPGRQHDKEARHSCRALCCASRRALCCASCRALIARPTGDKNRNAAKVASHRLPGGQAQRGNVAPPYLHCCYHDTRSARSEARRARDSGRHGVRRATRYPSTPKGIQVLSPGPDRRATLRAARHSTIGATGSSTHRANAGTPCNTTILVTR